MADYDDYDDYDNKTVKELRKECRDRKITVGGYKKDLVKRLNDHDNAFRKTGRTSRQTWEGIKSAWNDVVEGWKEGDQYKN